MLLIVGAAGGATGVTTGILVVGTPVSTVFCAAVVTITTFGSKFTALVGY